MKKQEWIFTKHDGEQCSMWINENENIYESLTMFEKFIDKTCHIKSIIMGDKSDSPPEFRSEYKGRKHYYYKS